MSSAGGDRMRVRRGAAGAIAVAVVIAAVAVVTGAHAWLRSQAPLQLPSLPARAPSAIDDPLAYEVYRAVLEQTKELGGGRNGPLVLLSESTAWEPCARVSGRAVDPAWQAAADRFGAVNASARPLLADADLGRPLRLITPARVHELFRSGIDGWAAFAAEYPGAGGYASVSDVGFDDSRTRAIVYVATHCGGLCGRGGIVFLHLVDGRWQPTSAPNLAGCDWIA